jgi:hypothetical protein
MGLKDVAPSIDHMNYVSVCKETWGHLAPRKNTTYSGVIRFAVGVFGSDDLNPTPIECELRSGKHELHSSPWFYDALTELLSDWACAGRYGNDPLSVPVEAGGVYEWRGTFRNYEFSGELRRMTLS